MKKHLPLILIAILSLILSDSVIAQQANHLRYVNPFIGTGKSNVFTKWGSEGGTYPGAVVPSGFIQLSPETRTGKGYNYADTSICYFSCFRHMSGFPEGSAGSFHIMPVNPEAGIYDRKFSHANETVSPGYYKVAFNEITIEATTTARSGLFRFTFAAGVTPMIFISDAGEISGVNNRVLHASNHHTVINFTGPFTDKKQVKDGWLFTFKSTPGNVIGLKISASSVDYAGAQKNIDAETGAASFDEIHARAEREWLQKLAVVDVNDSNEQNKTVFYTALYHSLLIPWVIDDADGRYRGADGSVHQKSGADQYGAFSPWDTFRSLHPLLTLLYPDKQKDVILSMLDIYRQTGHLPTESMTGNHAIPIIVDSYLKGITGFDKQLAYTAMKKSILESPFVQPDMEVYNQKGYIPFTRSESVTRTVEYAYDDWALSQFAKDVMHNDKDYKLLQARGLNYRNLLNIDQLLMLPRSDAEFKLNPGMSGYKEGDKWVYSYFGPHNAKDLINITGGNARFIARLDSALADAIPFDNETVFHIPYLFNQAGKPSLTQKWLREIMLQRFGNSPGGLPGNDDLGSTSSWYMFSAMGIYPVCPGRPYYAIGAPLFKSVTLHLPKGKTFTINANNSSLENNYVKDLKVNGKSWQQLIIPHRLIASGGLLAFDMADKPTQWPVDKNPGVLSETKQSPQFKILSYTLSTKNIRVNEPFTIHFSIKNTGAAGVKIVRLLVDDKPYAYKNCMVASGEVKKDSIICRLYPLGKTTLMLEGMPFINIEVKQALNPPSHPFKVSELSIIQMLRLNEQQQITYSVQNIGGVKQVFQIPVTRNDELLFTDTVELLPGEKKLIKHSIEGISIGFQNILIGGEKSIYKVYKDNLASLLLDLSPVAYVPDKLLKDGSGYQNNAHIIAPVNVADKLTFGENTFVEVPNAPSLDNMGETLTMMGWVYPTGNEAGLVDMITKGDSHVLQVSDHKTLTFFAGGWGRGDCTVNLPAGWNNKWHHIAGVCAGKTLYLYIDGVLAGKTVVETSANLSNNNKWTLGRNEEFPSERVFHGYMDKVKVFKEPLTADEIKGIVDSEGSDLK
ncbi:GH92 family glycosyl hydrolase [Mucilaginibacter celer]|uniref:LamG-like jellyroll fold domain-containing protein n=1 Tax=Mucilaginibacter celer TaxID=2305508 RepID=A0A494VPN0_9SPHI|nr:GH92 family glycosyl hydrolase [Mucilaginibacter celer]AYL96724.1 hypothetical protein HYN43_016075 [Mucilaginibacter celer]